MHLDRWTLEQNCNYEDWEELVIRKHNFDLVPQDEHLEKLIEASCSDAKDFLQKDYKFTGHSRQDVDLFNSHEQDKLNKSSIVDEDIVYLGSFIQPIRYMYYALLTGYYPTEDQRKLRQKNGTDFLQDDLVDIAAHYPQVQARLLEYPFINEKGDPVVDCYQLPSLVFGELLEVFYERGKDFRSNFWGFPWLSDIVKLD